MKTLHDSIQPNPNRRSKQVAVRFSTAELEVIVKMASKYSKGNISVWIRQAALRFKPSRDDLKP